MKKGASKALAIVQKFYPDVTSVKDATKKLRVEVTEKDDKNSRLKNHAECAMAVAAKRECHADGVIISVSTAYVIKDKVAYRYKVPTSVAREVVSFDRKAGFAPGEYALNPPTEKERLGVPASGSYKEKPNPKKQMRHTTENIRTSLIH